MKNSKPWAIAKTPNSYRQLWLVNSLKSTENLLTMKKIFNTLIWIAIIIMLAISMCSCSPVKKLDKLQRNHSYLFEKKMDTLNFHDTTEIVILTYQLDSTLPNFKLTQSRSITYSKENFKHNLFHDTITNINKLTNSVDTVYLVKVKEKKVPYNRYIVDAPKN